MIKIIIEWMNEGEDFKNSRLPMSLNDMKNEEGEIREQRKEGRQEEWHIM